MAIAENTSKGGGKIMSVRWADMGRPAPPPRSGDDIAREVVRGAGLKIKGR